MKKSLSALSTINVENFPFSIPVLVTSMRVENEACVIWKLSN